MKRLLIITFTLLAAVVCIAPGHADALPETEIFQVPDTLSYVQTASSFVLTEPLIEADTNSDPIRIPEPIAYSVPEPIKTWEENGYPADVGGAWFATGGYDPTDPVNVPNQLILTVYVLEGTSDARKTELVSMAPQDAKVEFRSCKYAYDTVNQLAHKIADEFGVQAKFTLAKNGNLVTVYIEEDGFAERSAAILEKYADKTDLIECVAFDPEDELTGFDGIPETGTVMHIDAPKSSSSVLLLLCVSIGLAVLLLIAVLVFVLHRSRAALLTDGSIVRTAKPTAKEVKKRIAAGLTPPSNISERLLK